MKTWRDRRRAIVSCGMAAVALTIVVAATIGAQTPPAGAAGVRRFPDGKPNLSGIWQANNTANWDVLTHKAHQGPVTALGAAFSVPGGIGRR